METSQTEIKRENIKWIKTKHNTKEMLNKLLLEILVYCYQCKCSHYTRCHALSLQEPLLTSHRTQVSWNLSWVAWKWNSRKMFFAGSLYTRKGCSLLSSFCEGFSKLTLSFFCHCQFTGKFVSSILQSYKKA